MCGEPNPGPLLEQPGLFATEPSLQPLVLFFRWFFSHLLDGCDQLRVYKHLVFGCFSSLCSLPPCWNIRQVFILFPLPNKSLEKRESLSAQVLMRALSLPDVSWFLILNKEITIWRRHNSLKWPQQFLIWELVAVTQQNSLAGRKEVKVCNSDLVIFPQGCDLSSKQTFKDYFRKFLVVITPATRKDKAPRENTSLAKPLYLRT